MARNALQMPDWVMPDLSGLTKAAELFEAAQKTKGDQGLEQQKISAANARQQWEQDRAQHQDDVEASNALDPNSPLMRAGSKSAALGNAMGKPYGITFDDQPDVPAMPNAEPAPLDQKSAQFLLGGGQHVNPGQPDPLLDFKPPPEAPAPEPMQGPAPTGAPLSAVPAAPHAEAPGPNIDQELAAREPAVTRSVHASFKGQRFAVPGNDKTSLFDEPKYNSMVDKLVGAGIPEKEAVAQVERVRHADIGEMGKNERFGAGLGQKQNTQLTREERMAEMEAGRAATHVNSVGRDNAIMGSAGLRADASHESAGNSEIRTMMQTVKEAKAAAGANKDIIALKNIEKMQSEINSDSPAAQNAAVDTFAQIAQGGKAGQVVLQVLQRHSIGPVEMAKDYAYRALNNGRHSPEFLHSFRSAINELSGVAVEQRAREADSFDTAVMPYGIQNPSLMPYVNSQRIAHYKNLGIPLPADLAPQGGAELIPNASPHGPRAEPIPTRKPRGAVAQPIPNAPQGHPAADPIGTRKPGPDGVLREKTAKGWIPVQ